MRLRASVRSARATTPSAQRVSAPVAGSLDSDPTPLAEEDADVPRTAVPGADRATTFFTGNGLDGDVDPSPKESHTRLLAVSPTPGAAQLHTPFGNMRRTAAMSTFGG